MARLYPPVIAGTLPAFSYKDGENEKIVVRIPYTHNRAVGPGSIDGFVLKIKDIQNNSIIYTDQNGQDYPDEGVVEFDITNSTRKFTPGTFYKAQIAYKGRIDNGYEIGYYSTVGVIKCTYEPEVYIEDLEDKDENNSKPTYLGYYSQKAKDPTEKIYSYNFTIYDNNNEVFETTGDLVHNHQYDDEIYESVDSFEPKRALKDNQKYYIKYSGVTTNGLEFSSPKYLIIQNRIVNPSSNINIEVTNNYENGYININLLGEKDPVTGQEKQAFGTFTLYRSSSEDKFDSFSKICDFELHGTLPSLNTWRDFTVKQGETYRYSIEQYNRRGIYSKKVYSNDVVAGFEDSFLYDGERQLRIRFNPKVASFKQTILESKQDTIGSKYPYFFRNGNVGYKEFSINGLLSYLMDNDELFIPKEEMYLDENLLMQRGVGIVSSEPAKRIFDNLQLATTNLVDYNIAAERIFKLKVLDWLNNGKPKLFRSPQEGNYIVRLMNCSLTPNDTVGRMLHTFQATAYEVDNFDYYGLSNYGLVFYGGESQDISYMNWKTVDVQEYFSFKSDYDYNDNLYPLDKPQVLYNGDSIIVNLKTPIPDVVQLGLKADVLCCDDITDSSSLTDGNFKLSLRPIGKGLKKATNELENPNVALPKLDNINWGQLINLRPKQKSEKFQTLDELITMDEQTWPEEDKECEVYYMTGFEIKLEGKNSENMVKNIRVIYSQEGNTLKSDSDKKTNDKTNHENWEKIGDKIVSLQCRDMIPGDQILLANRALTKEELSLDEETLKSSNAIKTIIAMGVTGTYIIDNTGSPVWVYIKYKTTHQGKITMGFYNKDMEDEDSKRTSAFDYYEDIFDSNICLRQFIGSTHGKDIREQLENVKFKVINYPIIHLVKRDIVDISAKWNETSGTWEYYYNNDIIPMDNYSDYVNDKYDLNDANIYYVHYGDSGQEDKKNNKSIYYDGSIGFLDEGIIDNLSFEAYIDDKIIDLSEIKEYTYTANGTPKIVLSDGVILDISVERKEIFYYFETRNNTLVIRKIKYQEMYDNLDLLIHDIKVVTDNRGTYGKVEGIKDYSGKEMSLDIMGDDHYELLFDTFKQTLQYQYDLCINKLEELLEERGAV